MFHQMLVWTKHVKNEMNKTSWFLYVQLNEIPDDSASKIKIPLLKNILKECSMG